MAVTMRDVARAAGVSIATVSFVLNRTPGQSIRPETADQVRAAAAELGYTPNRIARALREGSSRAVVLHAGTMTGGSLSSLIRGLDEELRENDHTLLVTYGDVRDDELLEAVAPRAVLDLDALYVTGAGDDEGGWADGIARHTTTQLDHLIGRGHRSIAYARGEDGMPALAELRTSHVREYLRRRALPQPPVVVVPPDRHSAAEAVGALLSAHPGVTAIAAFSDDVAIRVLAAAAVLGVRVPDDLAVIGFDESGLGALWTPSLTSVRIDAEGYGRRLARSALGLGEAPWPHDPSVVVKREST